MKYNELETTIKKHMLLEDRGIVKLLCATVIANRMEIPPPWLFIVGASSGGKSMLLNAMSSCDGMYQLDDLTPNTFLSGQAGESKKDKSLLYRLKRHSILSFKDFTTILQKHREAQGEIISQLRKIYDRDFSKTFGNGKEFHWKGKVGVIAGVTTKIYAAIKEHSDMGERFVMYHFKQPDDRIATTLWATERINDFKAEEEMRAAFKGYLDQPGLVPKEPPLMDIEIRKKLITLVEMASRARSGIERRQYSREREIEMVHDLEMPIRFTKQVMGFAMGHIAINRHEGLGDILLPQDEKTLYEIALDSIPRPRMLVMKELTKIHQANVKAMAVSMNLPSDTVQTSLDELNGLGVVSKARGYGSNQILWELRQEYREILSQYANIEMTDKTLIADSEDEPLPIEELGGHPLPATEIKNKKALDESIQGALEIFGGEVVEGEADGTI